MSKKTKMKEAIEEYQCSGCVSGSDIKCGNFILLNGCKNHCAGTSIIGLGRIFLGLPKGFNRLGKCKDFHINIFENYHFFLEKWGKKEGYDKFNIPVWKYRNSKGHILIRGLIPRINLPFLHIILDDKDFDKIQCLEITDKDLEGMD